MWLQTSPAPVRVVYEAGPTGYRLARACAEAGINCVVAAPSRIRAAAAHRVKTDRRDAERLARGCFDSGKSPPSVSPRRKRKPRAISCAREKTPVARSDAGSAPALEAAASSWGGVRRDRLDTNTRRVASPAAVRKGAAGDRVRRVLQPNARREEQTRRTRRSDHGACRHATVRQRRRAARLSARRLHANGVRVDGRAGRLAPVPSRVARTLPRAHPKRKLKRRATSPRRDHQGRQQPCTPAPNRGRLAPTPTVP